MLKPMLAATLEDIKSLRFPIYASYKLDGVRATIQNGLVLSRNLKPLPNMEVQGMFGHLESCDGEIVVGDANKAGVLQRTVSLVMSQKMGETEEVKFWVFDILRSKEGYEKRYEQVARRVEGERWARKLAQTVIESKEELEEFEVKAVNGGYEGVMVRAPNAPYKHGRSTTREGYLVKIKRWDIDEGEVVRCETLMHNANEATINELGRTVRSSKKEGKEEVGMLGALVIKTNKGQTVNVGSGFTMSQRVEMWNTRGSLVGRKVRFKHFPYGEVDAPRSPIFMELV